MRFGSMFKCVSEAKQYACCIAMHTLICRMRYIQPLGSLHEIVATIFAFKHANNLICVKSQTITVRLVTCQSFAEHVVISIFVVKNYMAFLFGAATHKVSLPVLYLRRTLNTNCSQMPPLRD